MEDYVKVVLLQTGRGAVAKVEVGEEGEEGIITLADGEYLTKVLDPETACRMAAEKLRELACRFEVLATANRPYSFSTQEKINRIKGR